MLAVGWDVPEAPDAIATVGNMTTHETRLVLLGRKDVFALLKGMLSKAEHGLRPIYPALFKVWARAQFDTQ